MYPLSPCGTANGTYSTARPGMGITALRHPTPTDTAHSYCNSIIQCLYYSAPFREHVINFPSPTFLEQLRQLEPSGPTIAPPSIPFTPYPNANSPARKPIVPSSPGQKPEESKDHPDNKKKLALAAGPVLDLQQPNSTEYWMEETLFTALRDIFDAIIGNQSRLGVAVPHRFLDILKHNNEIFRSAAHQDAHEFLNLVLNEVVDNVEIFSKQHRLPAPANGAPPESTDMVTFAEGTKAEAPAALDTNWVHDIFEGLLTSETRCLTCETTSQRDESFLDLSVDLEAHSSVTSCLRKFSEEEMLCERNKFHCDNCGGLQEAEKRMKIKRLPRILALHLKRFKWTEDMQRLQKLFHRVVYPFYLRMFNTTDDAEDPDRLYELYAVVVHIGAGPYHGHYVSVIKTPDRGWMLFDDELVEPVSKDYVTHFFGGEAVPGVQDAKQLSCAYVLFYQETTMEAMLREQDAEARQTKMAKSTVPVNTSDAEVAKDLLSQAKQNGNGLHHINTVTSPHPAEMEHMDPLVHAATSPQIKSPLTSVSTNPTMEPVTPSKSKKELKQEEKERKAAEKAAEKEREEKRRAANAKRMEDFRKADEEMKRVMEESKATAAEEASSRGEQPVKQEKHGGLSRFRAGSLSIRGKSKFLGGGKDKQEKEKLPPVPQGNGNGTAHMHSNSTTERVPLLPSESNGGTTDEAADSTTALPPMPLARTNTPMQEEGKVKKNRFSLGRKKSTLI